MEETAKEKLRWEDWENKIPTIRLLIELELGKPEIRSWILNTIDPPTAVLEALAVWCDSAGYRAQDILSVRIKKQSLTKE